MNILPQIWGLDSSQEISVTCWYPDLAEDVLKGLYTQIRPALMLFIEAAGYLLDCDIILMQIAYCLKPARLHPALLIECIPYTRPETFLERMNAAARHGWLYQEGGEFGLTDPGLEIVEGLYDLCDRLYPKINALSDPEMVRLRYLSDRVIDKIKQLREPVEKPALELNLLFERCLNRPLIVQLRQRMFILLAFRDDAHVAAWRPYESDGQLWEAFTLIWREQAGSAAELVEQLPHRNYAERDYAAALEKLIVRGWLTVQGDRYIPKEEAIQMRQEVEDRTDLIFNAAFAGLSTDEMKEFQRLMQKFSVAVRPTENLTK